MSTEQPHRMRKRTVAALLACSAGAAAWAQYAVPQDGRLLESSNQVGARGYNQSLSRPMTPLLGNLSASGNLSRGLSLRSVSPIDDPTAFRASLGSSSLFEFRRDSVSSGDALRPFDAGLPRAYYDPARTVYDARLLQGGLGDARGPVQGWSNYVPQLSSSTAGLADSTLNRTSAEPLDLRLDMRLDTGIDPSVARGFVPPQRTGELSSSIFGPASGLPQPTLPFLTQPSADGSLPQTSTLEALARARRAEAYRAGTGAPPLEGAAPADYGGPQPANPLDLLVRGEVPAQVLDLRVNLDASEEQTLAKIDELLRQPATPPGEASPTPAAEAPRAPLALTDVSMLPGYDVFSDMQLAMQVEGSADTQWFDEIKQAAQDNPQLANQLFDLAQLDARAFADRVLNAPVRTFVGRGASSVNDELLKAESLLDIGRFYEAAQRYESARILDPANPLPLVGKGHALLAAGDYLSAAVSLVRGFERFPELTRLQVDLKSFLGEGEIIDVRRADILSRLAQREDPRLRFLLGYLEYYTGSRESGLTNLKKAAADAEVGSIISRFPDLLTGAGKLPAPKLPAAEPTLAPLPTLPEPLDLKEQP